MTPRHRRIAKVIVSALFVLVLAGVTYQGVSTGLERRAFSRPGRLVPVGDHQLHITCTGEGRPTVVLEAPALGFSASWSLVQPQLAAVTRVCAYDRAGLGWSEASDAPRDVRTVPAELLELLRAAGEAAPYLLVGDGLGAAYARAFASEFPSATAGIVTVEPEGAASGQEPSPWLARTGILRLSYAFGWSQPRVPGPRGGAIDAFSTRPDHLTRGGIEIRQRGRLTAPSTAPALVRSVPTPSEGTLLTTEDGARSIVTAVSSALTDWRRTSSSQTP